MSSPPSLAVRARPWLSVALKAAVTAALIAWLLTRIDVDSVVERLGRFTPASGLAGVAVMFGQLLLAGERWRLICRAIDVTLRPVAIRRLTLIGQFFSQTLPSAVGGDAVRAWLASREGVTLGRALSSVIVDRVVALVAMVSIMALTLPAFFARVPDPAPRAAVALLPVGVALGIALLLWQGTAIVVLLHRFKLTRPFATLAADFRAVLARVPGNLPIFALALTVQAMVSLSAFLLAQSLEIHASFVDCLVLIPPIVLVTMLPISIAGWGVRESAMVTGFGFIGVAQPDALALSVVFGLAQIAVGIPGGLLWLATGRAAPPVPERNPP